MIFSDKNDFLLNCQNGRLICFDVGTKNIGVAVTDNTQTIVTPSSTIRRKGNKQDFTLILKLLEEKKIKGIIVGLPLSFNEEDTKCSLFVKRFTNNLSLITNIPIIYQDERLSSFEAEDLMLDKVGYNKTKCIVDKIAASYILEDFLNN